jgi:hypothetical protein
MKNLAPALLALCAFAIGFFLGRQSAPSTPEPTSPTPASAPLALAPSPLPSPPASPLQSAPSPAPAAESPPAASTPPAIDDIAASFRTRLGRPTNAVATIDSLALSESEAVAVETALELARADLRASERARRTLSQPSPDTTVCLIAPSPAADEAARSAYRQRVLAALGEERGSRAWTSLASDLEREFPPHDQPRRVELRRLSGNQVQVTEEHRLGSRRGQRTSVSNEVPENLRHLFAP